jgi:putative two-component system response regulator
MNSTTLSPLQVPTSSGTNPLVSQLAGTIKQRPQTGRRERYGATYTQKIVLIDDEELNTLIVQQYLKNSGYQNIVAVNEPKEALKAIQDEKPDLILLDIVMPEISGLQILEVLSITDLVSSIPVLVLTASSDASIRSQCLELGAADFLAKPLDPTDLVPRVRNALENKLNREQMAKYAVTLEQEVRIRTEELASSRMEVVRCLARAAERRDDDTGQHIVRVGRYVGVIAQTLGMSAETVAMLEMAAQLHDIGKIAIPDSILHKPGKLTADEFKRMQTHCEIARSIISPAADRVRSNVDNVGRAGTSLQQESTSPLMKLASRIAETHHEKWDGSGYPNGLKGHAIPIEGRMTAVADVFDALSSKRPYKEAFPLDKCLEIIREGSGRHFDPMIVEAFMARLPEIQQIQAECAD